MPPCAASPTLEEKSGGEAFRTCFCSCLSGHGPTPCPLAGLHLSGGTVLRARGWHEVCLTGCDTQQNMPELIAGGKDKDSMKHVPAVCVCWERTFLRAAIKLGSRSSRRAGRVPSSLMTITKKHRVQYSERISVLTLYYVHRSS